MAFVTIDPNKIKVGDPITKELFDVIKENFDTHQAQLLALDSVSDFYVFNRAVSFVAFNIYRPEVFIYKAQQDFTINDFRAQLFTLNGVNSGDLTFEFYKSPDPDAANFSTILVTPLNFDFAVDAAYTERVANLDVAETSILTGEFLIVAVTNCPNNLFGHPFSGTVQISVGAQV